MIGSWYLGTAVGLMTVVNQHSRSHCFVFSHGSAA